MQGIVHSRYLVGGAGTCAVNAFDDDLLNNLLNIEGREIFLIFMAAVAKGMHGGTRERLR